MGTISPVFGISGAGGAIGGGGAADVGTICSGSKLRASYDGYSPFGQRIVTPFGSSLTKFLSKGKLFAPILLSGCASTQPGNSTIGNPTV